MVATAASSTAPGTSLRRSHQTAGGHVHSAGQATLSTGIICVAGRDGSVMGWSGNGEGAGGNSRSAEDGKFTGRCATGAIAMGRVVQVIPELAGTIAIGRVGQEIPLVTGAICIGRVGQATPLVTGAICIGRVGQEMPFVTGAICMGRVDHDTLEETGAI